MMQYARHKPQHLAVSPAAHRAHAYAAAVRRFTNTFAPWQTAIAAVSIVLIAAVTLGCLQLQLAAERFSERGYTPIETLTTPAAEPGQYAVEVSAAETQASLIVLTHETDSAPAAAQETVRYDESSEVDVPAAESGFKSYMDYRTITDRSSRQYAMQQQAWTDANGFRRYGDYYMVAMGTYYGSCGDTYHIVLEGGGEFDVILGDVKADIHTDELNQHANGNVLEFIVDDDVASRECLYMGDMSYAGEMFSGKITHIYKIL